MRLIQKGPENSGPCDSHRIQTCNLLIRSQMLYSVELANRLLGFASAKLGLLFESAKFFGIFFEQN